MNKDKAMQQALEPTPWRDMVVVSLVREGINKHKARELADHFAAQPEQQAEPVACRFCFSKKGCWTWQCYHCGEIDDVQQPAQPLPVQEPMAWDKPSASFNAWWDSYRHDGGNPFQTDSFAYWAFAGWQAALAQRPWQGLEAEDLAQIESDDFWQIGNHMAIAMAVEAKLKELNK